MAESDYITNGKNNLLPKTITKIESRLLHSDITVLDLRNQNLKDIDDSIILPTCLVEIDISNNELTVVPGVIFNLENLKCLNLSHNAIEYFDNTPAFCNTLERLDLSNNKLLGPPYWIWAETTENLTHLYLHNNCNIMQSLKNEYLEEIINYSVSVTEISAYNCCIYKCMEFMTTLSKVKTIILGVDDFSYYNNNKITEIPCKGLDGCDSVEKLMLCYTYIYTINTSIYMYGNIKELDLSHNIISCLPEEFCSLENLEICNLSYNKIRFLPEDINKLNNLRVLLLNCNDITCVTENLCTMHNLKHLDLYDNYIMNFSNKIIDILDKIDLAQNCIVEPEDENYLTKKKSLRLQSQDRIDGRKTITLSHTISLSEHSDYSNEFIENEADDEDSQDCQVPSNASTSSIEDWDSDDYWVPHYLPVGSPPPFSPWHYFVIKKMREGNFCPIDYHPAPFSDRVVYNVNHIEDMYETDGQFDDCSDDNS